MEYCEHEKDIEAWWISNAATKPPVLTCGNLCVSCFKELQRGGRTLENKKDIDAWWRENSR